MKKFDLYLLFVIEGVSETALETQMWMNVTCARPARFGPDLKMACQST
jgi:hypothetical protein